MARGKEEGEEYEHRKKKCFQWGWQEERLNTPFEGRSSQLSCKPFRGFLFFFFPFRGFETPVCLAKNRNPWNAVLILVLPLNAAMSQFFTGQEELIFTTLQEPKNEQPDYLLKMDHTPFLGLRGEPWK